MTEPIIHKADKSERVAHYLADYAEARSSFSWEAARLELTGSPGLLNMAHEAVDRHVEQGHGARLAARFIDGGWTCVDVTYAQLQSQCSRFANVLRALKIERGMCVATLFGRVPELFIVALGTLKAGGVYCSLFSAFGPEPLKTRLQLGHARVLVTSEMLYRRKVAAIRDALPELRHVLIVRDDEHAALPDNTVDFADLMRLAEETYETAATHDDDIALLHFTSGTTGKPKGVTLTHAAVIAQQQPAG